jgi:hypothetical protein
MSSRSCRAIAIVVKLVLYCLALTPPNRHKVRDPARNPVATFDAESHGMRQGW